jgi:transcriptional regulator with XRE-family HTH domain
MHNSGSVDINGNKIRLLREQNDLTQLYLATVVGVTTDTISRWENRRYPSIKLENARKLADALGVPLEELLEEKEHDGSVDTAAPAPLPQTFWFSVVPSRYLLFLGGIGIALLGVVLFLLLNRGDGVATTATRILPSHASYNLPFPVRIEISGAADWHQTLLIREELSGDCMAIGPSEGNTPKQYGKKPSWIGTLADGRATFLYMVHPLVQPKAQSEYQNIIKFSGDLVYREGQAVGEKIGGPDTIALTPYHWADIDQDYVINDNEILLAYETFSVPGQNLIYFAAIEELWLAGGYTRDAQTLSFIPVSSEQDHTLE